MWSQGIFVRHVEMPETLQASLACKVAVNRNGNNSLLCSDRHEYSTGRVYVARTPHVVLE